MFPRRVLLLILLLAGAGAAHGADLAKLLVATSWCSSTRDPVSGSRHTSRVVFRADGSYVATQGRDAAESTEASRGRWQLKRGRLYLTEQGSPEAVPVQIRRDARGRPILIADGEIFARCR